MSMRDTERATRSLTAQTQAVARDWAEWRTHSDAYEDVSAAARRAVQAVEDLERAMAAMLSAANEAAIDPLGVRDVE